MVEPGPAAAGAPGAGLPDATVEDCLARLDAVLGRLETTPEPGAELAMEAIAALAEVYGTALARVMAVVSGVDGVAERLVEDELLHHLFALHGVHPLSLDERVAGALERVRPVAQSHGGDVQLVEVAGDVARVRFVGSCSGRASSNATLQRLVAEAVLTVAPELSMVEAVTGDAAPPAVIPVYGLRRLPTTRAAR